MTIEERISRLKERKRAAEEKATQYLSLANELDEKISRLKRVAEGEGKV